MSEALQKVKPGDSLVVPAQTFNTFVDAAREYLPRRQACGSATWTPRTPSPGRSARSPRPSTWRESMSKATFLDWGSGRECTYGCRFGTMVESREAV